MLYLLRHGETKANLENRFAGWTDEPLTGRGRKQAEDIARILKKHDISCIYTSPLPRTVETASIMSAILDVPVKTEDGLSDIRIPYWDGRSKKDLLNDPASGYSTWKKSPHLFEIDGAETLSQLQKRAVSACTSILEQHKAASVALVSHLAVLRCLVLYFTDRGLDSYRDIDIPNAQPLVLTKQDDYFKIDSLECGGN